MSQQATLTVHDTVAARCTLEPMTCVHCKQTGNVTYLQAVGDAHCGNCGEWQLPED